MDRLSGCLPAALRTGEGSSASTVALRWAAVACVPAALYFLRPRAPADDYRTDFDGFLKAQEEIGSTGCTSAAVSASSNKKEKKSGPIDAFFRNAGEEEVDHRNPLDFDTFIKKAGAGTVRGSSKAGAVAVKQKPAGPTAEHVRVVLLYGTEYGFSKEVAEKLAEQLKAVEAVKYWPALVDMAEHPEGMDLSKEQAVLAICSTQGDGVPPTEARSFCEWLFAGKAGSLGTLAYSVLALGDKSYTHFCRCGKQLDAAFDKAGALQVVERVDINKEDWAAINGWMAAIVTALPLRALKTLGELGGFVAEGPIPTSSKASKKRFGKSRPFMADVVALEGLCTLSGPSDKNTLRVEFDLADSGLTYLPGDALGIYPSNPPTAVDELLEVLGASAHDPVPRPSWAYEEAGSSGAALAAGAMHLRDALLFCYDIRAPKLDLLHALWELLPAAAKSQASIATAAANGNGHLNGHVNGHADGSGSHLVNGDSGHGTPLKDAATNGHAANGIVAGPAAAISQAKVLQPLLADPVAAEAYLAQRHVVDLLLDFSSARIAALKLLPLLRQLQPRLYSISSSPLEHPTRVQATVAEVKYETLGRSRVGVCSTHLSERLQVGGRLPVYIHKNPDFRLPASPTTPILMVGPGTGLAPFRSFILQRLLERKQAVGSVVDKSAAATDAAAHTAVSAPQSDQETPTSSSTDGRMVLYFGCRRNNQDYLYGSDLEAWAAAGDITLFTAFSRQQAKKVYVQQRVRESGALIWQLLQAGGHFYVCGDAGSMAGAVEVALLEVIAKHQGQGEVAAAAYLAALTAGERYQRDVWFS